MKLWAQKSFRQSSRTWLATASLLLAGTHAASAQSAACGIATRPGVQGLYPTLQGEFTNPSILTQLQRGYDLIATRKEFEPEKVAFHSALDAAVATQNVCAEGLATLGLGKIARRVSFRDAEPLLLRAETAFSEIHATLALASTHYDLAGVNTTLGKDKVAAEFYQKAALEYEEGGNPVSALSAKFYASHLLANDNEGFNKLLAEAQRLKVPCTEASILQTWGDRAHNEVNYEAAMEHYQAADAVYQRCATGAGDREGLQTSMGRLERQHGRPDMALPHYRIALRLQQQEGDPSYIPQTYNAMAVAYEAMHDYPRAIAFYKKGLAVAEQIHSQPFIDFLQANLGATYLRAGQPAAGIPLLEKASQNLNSDTLVCHRLSQLADAYLRVGRYQEAVSKNDIAIPACERSNNKEELSNNYTDRANAKMHLGQLDAALADSQLAIQLVEDFRAHLVQRDAYKQGYTDRDQITDTYSVAVEVYMQLHRYADAMETAERARSRAFLDLLSSEQANGKQSDATIATQPERSSQTSRDLDSRISSTARNATQIVEEATRLHSTLLSFWMSRTTLYTWVVRPGQSVAGFSQPMLPSQLARLVKATQPGVDPGTANASDNKKANTILTRGGTRLTLKDNGTASWRKLYFLLIAPIQDHLPTEKDSLLTIIPSGPLFQLSFAALMDPHGQYLVERYRTHTIPTIGLLQFTQHNAAIAAQQPLHYLFVANPEHLPNGTNGRPLPQLPGTALEVEAITRILPATEVTLLTSAKAQQRRVIADIPQATVIHFATHAVVDDIDSSKTFLALDTSQPDGRLTLNTVYGLNLHTRLVVLSACRTGLGKITGDGVQGLSRAFFYAGSASILTTLWDVADQPTAIMLPRFYRALQNGQTATDSLRTAQLGMLRDLRLGRIKIKTLQGDVALPPAPSYWAAFALSGEP